MVLVTSKRLLMKLLILHLIMFFILGFISNFSLVDDEINIKDKTYTAKINFIIPMDKDKFTNNLKVKSKLPNQALKYKITWLNSTTVELKISDTKIPQGQEINISIDGAKTKIPLVKKNETIDFRIPIKPKVVGLNIEKYLPTSEPLIIKFNVPMNIETGKKKITVMDLESGKKLKGSFEALTRTINGKTFKDNSQWVFKPDNSFQRNKKYKVTVKAGIVSETELKLMKAYSRIITVPSKPSILEHEPKDRSENVSLYPKITLVTSESLKRAKVTLRRQDKNLKDIVKGTVLIDKNKTTFRPEVALLPDSKYTLEFEGFSIHNEPTTKTMISFSTLDMKDKYWIDVKLGEIHTVTVYKGQLIVRHMVASGGKEETKTPLGTYYTGDKGYSFWSPRFGEGALYWVRLVGQILFHSVPRGSKGELKEEEHYKLGLPASHGCIRLDDKDAKWIFDNIPFGTQVIIHE